MQAQKQARSLKFQIYEEQRLHYLCSENKGADQLCTYCTADLRLLFLHRQKSGFLASWLIYALLQSMRSAKTLLLIVELYRVTGNLQPLKVHKYLLEDAFKGIYKEFTSLQTSLG